MSDAGEFEANAERVIAAARREAVAQCWVVKVPANRPPWTSTGIELSAGDQVSVFSAGRAAIVNTDIWVGSHSALWMRIGRAGRIFRAPGNSFTFTCTDGELYLANLFPGDWADAQGRLATNPRDFERVTGEFVGLVLRWSVDPLDGLDQLIEKNDPADASIMRAEAERLKKAAVTPAGWHYLWSVGDTGSFKSACDESGNPTVRCRMRDDGAILQRPIRLGFGPATRLRWRWKIDALPSARREDSVATHDYLSIAVEFENGQDLTYFWSAALPPGTSFRCPISRWHGRETHMAVRTGTKDLGKWVSEDRNVWEDYRQEIGSPPATIVAVWLIGVSIFSHSYGACEYAGIELVTDNHSVWREEADACYYDRRVRLSEE